MQKVPLFIGRRKRGLRSFSSALETARFFGRPARHWRIVHMKSFSLLTAVSMAVLAAVPSVVSAQQKTLYVAGYGGSFEKTIRDEVIPAFEKANGVKVEYVAGNSTDTLAKLQAQKGNQQIDVAIVDDGPMYQAIQLGFCGKIEGVPADLYEAEIGRASC